VSSDSPGRNFHQGISFEEIIALMRQRRSQDTLLFTQGIEIRDRYNGDVVLPMNDVQGKPVLDPPGPRLIAQAIDGNAMRAAASRPSILCPATDLTRENAYAKAELRRKMMWSKWHYSAVDLKLYRSYRHLAAYGTCAWVVMPDETGKHARVEIRDPLTAYPELRSQDDVRDPKNCGFIYGRSLDWIAHHYPEAQPFIENAGERNWDTLWDMVEWIDEDDIVIGILGPRMPAYSPQDSRPYGYTGYEIKRWKNKAGMVPVVVPRRATLDRIHGQMSTLINTIDLYTRMVALGIIAAEKHTFPDVVVESAPNMEADVNGGQGWYDGRSGKANIVRDGRANYLVAQPPPFVLEMLHEMESGLRESGGASSFFGGDTPTALRTGRAIDTLGSFSIDPRIEESQRIMAATLTQLLKACVHVEKGYWPTKKFVGFTGLIGDDAMVTYVPSKDLTSDECVVEYPLPGADINQMSVALAQLTGAGLMSKETAMTMHPAIHDERGELRRLTNEQMDAAILGSIAQQAAQGAIPPSDVARIKQLVVDGKSIEDAVTQAHKEAQARQAQQAPPAGPGQVAAPETQPGLAQPGAGAEQPQPVPAIPGPSSNQQAYQKLAQALNAQPRPTPMPQSPANA
jgi:hypothetical protein